MIFSGESTRECECVDTFVFCCYMYRFGCSSIRSVLFEPVALVVRRLEADFTITCSIAKSTLSRRITIRNQWRNRMLH